MSNTPFVIRLEVLVVEMKSCCHSNETTVTYLGRFIRCGESDEYPIISSLWNYDLSTREPEGPIYSHGGAVLVYLSFNMLDVPNKELDQRWSREILLKGWSIFNYLLKLRLIGSNLF